MAGFGRQEMEKVGRSIQVTADGAPKAKAGGITIDWGTVAAATVPATYEDNDPVVVGEKFLRYGQIMCKITATGKFGPYDAAATDGRQLMVKGDCYILNMSVHEDVAGSDYGFGGAIDGGRVWKARLLIGGAGQPTLAAFEAAFPNIVYALD